MHRSPEVRDSAVRSNCGAIFNSPSASASVRAGYHTQPCIPHNAGAEPREASASGNLLAINRWQKAKEYE